MKSIVVSLLFYSIILIGYSQEIDNPLNRTITIRKSDQFSKVLYDDVNYRLIAIDIYGNVMDTAVVEFEMSVTIKGIGYSESVYGNVLSPRMQKLVGTCDKNTKLLFDKIKVKDSYRNIIEMPKFYYLLGHFKENND